MAALSALHPYVLPAFPNTPEMAVDRAIRDAAIQFCRESLVWQETLPPIQLKSGVALYEVEPEATADPVRVLSARVGSRRLERSIIDSDGVSCRCKCSGEDGFTQATAFEIELTETPTSGGELVLRIALEPRSNTNALDDELVRAWREPIAAGARAKLYGIDSMAGAEYALFQRGIELARAQAIVGLNRGRLRTTLSL